MYEPQTDPGEGDDLRGLFSRPSSCNLELELHQPYGPA